MRLKMRLNRKLRRLGSLAALVGLGVILAWLQEANTPNPFALIPEEHGEPDYYIEGAQLTRYNAQGQAFQVLNSPEVTHYPEQNLSLLSQPVLVHHTEDGQTWHLTAATAQHQENQNLIYLEDQVKLSPQNPETAYTPEFITSKLWINNLTKEAFTPEPVEFISPNGLTAGVGFKLNLNNGQALIEQQVQGQYLPPNHNLTSHE